MPEVTESVIPVQPTRARPRLDSIDVLRRLVMVIMALDAGIRAFLLSLERLRFHQRDCPPLELILIAQRQIARRL